MSQLSSDSPEDRSASSLIHFCSQPFYKLQQRLISQSQPYYSLFSYFLEQPALVESAAPLETSESEATESDNLKTSTSHTGSNRRESHSPNPSNTLPTLSDKEAFFMSNAINNLGSLESNGYSLIDGHMPFITASVDSPIPTASSYFAQSDRTADETLDSPSINPDKVALNDHRESTPSLKELAQIQTDLKQLIEVQIRQAASIQALNADNQTLRARVNELHARGEAQDKMLAEYRGGLRAIETAFTAFKIEQCALMGSFEQTYQEDKIQTGCRQQAKDQQMEVRLQSLLDPMLAEAIEKAIRLLRLDGRRIPTPAKHSSTPALDHLYINQVNRQKQTD